MKKKTNCSASEKENGRMRLTATLSPDVTFDQSIALVECLGAGGGPLGPLLQRNPAPVPAEGITQFKSGPTAASHSLQKINYDFITCVGGRGGLVWQNGNKSPRRITRETRGSDQTAPPPSSSS